MPALFHFWKNEEASSSNREHIAATRPPESSQSFFLTKVTNALNSPCY